MVAQEVFREPALEKMNLPKCLSYLYYLYLE